MIDSHIDRFLFVIDTDEYAGNFERQMCAFCTGVYGDCGIGDTIAQKFENEFKDKHDVFANIVLQVNDDRECARPVTIYPTPGFWNDGMGKHSKGDPNVKGRWPAYQSVAIFFSEPPSTYLIKFMKDRARLFAKTKEIKILGFRLIHEYTVVEILEVENGS